MITAAQDPAKTDGKIQSPIKVKTKDPAKIEEGGLIAEAVRLAAGHLIVVAASTGMEVGSNAGMPSGVNKADLLEDTTGWSTKITTLIK